MTPDSFCECGYKAARGKDCKFCIRPKNMTPSTREKIEKEFEALAERFYEGEPIGLKLHFLISIEKGKQFIFSTIDSVLAEKVEEIEKIKRDGRDYAFPENAVLTDKDKHYFDGFFDGCERSQDILKK